MPLAFICKNEVMVAQGAPLDPDTPLHHLHKLKMEHFLQALNGEILPQADGIIAVTVNVLQNHFRINLMRIVKLY